MIKTESEYLFVIIAGQIGMVRKDGDNFTVVPVSDDGNLMVPFDSPDPYWKQWVALSNFSLKRNRIDFAFIVDDLKCKLRPDEYQNDFKRVTNTVWTLANVEKALRTVQAQLGLNNKIAIDENGISVLRIEVDSSGDWQILHLIRFGNVDDGPVENDEPAEDANKKKQDQTSKAESTKLVLREQKKALAQAIDGLAADCLLNDVKAQGLKGGDVISGKIARLSQVRNRCFIDSDDLSQQLRIFYNDLSEYCKATQRPIPSEGDNVSFKVLSVSQSDLINLKLELGG